MIIVDKYYHEALQPLNHHNTVCVNIYDRDGEICFITHIRRSELVFSLQTERKLSEFLSMAYGGRSERKNNFQCVKVCVVVQIFATAFPSRIYDGTNTTCLRQKLPIIFNIYY